MLFFLPETKSLTLEELDQVFSVPTEKHAKYQGKEAVLWLRRTFLRQKNARQPPLYQIGEEFNEKSGDHKMHHPAKDSKEMSRMEKQRETV